ncbi:MAG: hypothetical protein IKX99_02490 [Lachnospiraceae bacterium]|nr:hypothetical protein [Lachnospiraceae bacterium]MBR5788959.1 hypothetical protein [Lachnospiraceae bacterium]
MKWYKPLYIGESIEKKKIKIIWKIKHNVLQPNIYLILLSANGKDNFKIIPSALFLQKFYPKDDEYILGLANGKDEAIKLVGRMVDDAVFVTNDPHKIREYFSLRE